MNQLSNKDAELGLTIFDRLPSLSIALEKLFGDREKRYGCFQVFKEDGFFYLDIPYFPTLKLQKNEANYIYKIYWLKMFNQRDENEIDVASTSNESPAIFVRKKQRKIYTNKDYKVEKLQKIYEIVIKRNNRNDIQTVNKMIASFIQDRIKQNLSQMAIDEVTPLVSVVEES
jgi:hypothetical protein